MPATTNTKYYKRLLLQLMEGEAVAAVGGECRICQEEEDNLSTLDSPCSCSGTLKYAHRKCIQRWCDEKGNTTCEICHQSFKGGYTAPVQSTLHMETIRIEIGENWGVTAPPHLFGPHRYGIYEPHILTLAAEQRFLDAEYDGSSANGSVSAYCRSAALILMALLLLRHALSMASDETLTTTFMFFFRVAGFLLPVCVMVHAMNVLQRRRQQQEAAMAAMEVAMLLQGQQAQGIHIAISSGSSSAAHDQPLS